MVTGVDQLLTRDMVNLLVDVRPTFSASTTTTINICQGCLIEKTVLLDALYPKL